MRYFVKPPAAPGRGGIRPQRRRPSRPLLERLEGRDLPAAGPLGINVIPEFVDAMKQSGDWSPAPGASTVTRDANGWPTSDAEITVADDRVNQPWDGPDPSATAPDISGTYHLSFQGQATVSPPSWMQEFTVQNQVYNAATNTTTADVVLAPGYPLFIMDFTNTRDPASATGAGVTDVKLIRPGYAANTTQVFTNNLLNDLAPFNNLRFMDATETNDYPATVNGQPATTGWSQRRLPTDSSQTDAYDGKLGIAWEYVVELANEADKDIWINVPATATDDYVRQLANLIKNGDTVDGVTYAGLKPGLKVYVEYSNEVWNSAFPQSAYNTQEAEQEAAAANSPLTQDGISDAYTLAGRRYLERSMQVADIFAGVFGPDPTHGTLRPVLAWQEGSWSWYYESELPWFESNFGPASQTFYGLGYANYFSPDDYSSVDAIIASLIAKEPTAYQDAAQFATIASYYGLKSVAYEGGPSLGGDGNTTQGINSLAALRDPRMEGIVEQYYLDWYAAGGDQADFYSGPYGIWGPDWPWPAAEASQAADPSLSPKYRGLVDVADAPPAVVTAATPVSATGTSFVDPTTDTLGDAFSQPTDGQQGYWLVDAAAGGVYDLTLTTGSAAASASGQVAFSVNDRWYSTSIAVGGGQTIDLGEVTLRPGLNTLSLYAVRAANDPGDQGIASYFAWTPLALDFHGGNPAATASFAGLDSATRGDWPTAYGAEGYALPGGPTALGAGATIATSGADIYTWIPSTTDPRAPRTSATSGVGMAACWFSGSSFTINVGLPDGRPHEVAVSALDLDNYNGGRVERIDLLDSATGAVLDSRTISGFQKGVYLAWDVVGDVSIRVTNLNPSSNAVISGLFLGGTSVPTASVAFAGSDTTTGGSWMSAYGAAGYVLPDGPTTPGPDATVTTSGATEYTWTAGTADARATVTTPASGSRTASCWTSPSTFSIDVALNDGRSHRLAIYAVDWDDYNGGRDERIDLLDTATGTVLDSRTISSFQKGVYLVWNVTGDVTIRVTNLNRNSNAVVSGLFLGGAPASGATLAFAGTDTTTRGAWTSSYGVQGYDVIGGQESLPSYATVSSTGASVYTWSSSTTNPRAPLASSATAAGVAACEFSASTFSIDVALTDGKSHELALYALDWDGYGGGRSERIDVIDDATGALLDSRTISGFENGVYLVWNLTGSVTLRVTNLNPSANAVISGLFLGGAAAPAASVTYAGMDSVTQGSWAPAYGSDGSLVFGGQDSLPSYATLSGSGLAGWVWSASTSDPRAPFASATSTARAAACAFSASTFSLDVGLTDGKAHRVSLYALDWDDYGGGRSERIDLLDSATGAVLDSRTISGFQKGVYLSWNVTGSVTFRVTNLNPSSNAVISGLFLGRAAAAANAASFVGTDTATQGAWASSYGAQGYDVIGGQESLPSYASMTQSGAYGWVWSSSTADPRAPESSTGPSASSTSTAGVAACWASPTSFSVNVALTDGRSHRLALYALDWDGYGGGRDERIDLLDTATGTVLDSRTISSFQKGVYLVWNVTGDVTIRVTNLNPASNAVISGLFVD